MCQGKFAPLLTPSWLYFRFKRWLIFYQPHPQGIEILRVIDGARDLLTHLGIPGSYLRLVDSKQA